jgi:GNAT superfamily N-acetyltransferase
MVEVRVATRGDLPAIMELLNADYIPPCPQRDAPTQEQVRTFETIAAHPEHEIAVAMLDGEVVGTLQLMLLPGLAHGGGWRAQVEAVRVRAGLRNQRIGTRMMEWAIARARERGCWVMQLTSNKMRVDAHRFYERLGFKLSHVGMKLEL